ncbi:hypothetical protein AOQ84DRAFT_369262 [Glonium stellatum]|uniref:Uncharacterized protein n=1 Tax=Glonium stellatum TaxID=574774 RepID=A0A8E2EPB1_9PEZI|nr:hypothetical protein AOQ84DRAFT_369262 [Glonium stellatum]
MCQCRTYVFACNHYRQVRLSSCRGTLRRPPFSNTAWCKSRVSSIRIFLKTDCKACRRAELLEEWKKRDDEIADIVDLAYNEYKTAREACSERESSPERAKGYQEALEKYHALRDAEDRFIKDRRNAVEWIEEEEFPRPSAGVARPQRACETASPLRFQLKLVGDSALAGPGSRGPPLLLKVGAWDVERGLGVRAHLTG